MIKHGRNTAIVREVISYKASSTVLNFFQSVASDITGLGTTLLLHILTIDV